MVSEDSQRLGWFPEVHRLLDLRNFDDPVDRQVSAAFHQSDDSYELLKVVSLRSSQWVLLEEGDDLRAEVIKTLNAISKEILPMIVMSTIPKHLSAPEELNEILENVSTGLALNNRKFRSDLPLQSHLRTSIDGTAEAAFPIYETHDPSGVAEPFLLIFRRGPCQPHTVRIVTAIHAFTLIRGWDTKPMTSTNGYTGFSSI